jgi:sulfatase modifying factor 1
MGLRLTTWRFGTRMAAGLILTFGCAGCLFDWDSNQLPAGQRDDGSTDVDSLDGLVTEDGRPEDGAEDATGPDDGNGEDGGPPPVVPCTAADTPGCVVSVPSGTFNMGLAGVAEPVHEVILSADFDLQRYEVSVGEYRACVVGGACTDPGTGGGCNWSPATGSRENHPVNCVAWSQADAYCAWLGGTLPTEAQWEHAARGAGDRTYPWGEGSPTCALANHAPGGTPCVGGTAAVNDGTYRGGASAFGVWQMAGNVWEWTADWYEVTYSCTAPCRDPFGPATGTERVIRGGAWDVESGFVRSAVRSGALPEMTDDDLGFRCAWTVP